MKKLDIAKLSAISKNLKILYVEDDDFIMESMKTLLKDIFNNVQTAPNGLEALEAIASSKYDVLLTDAIMPKMDGPTLIGELKKMGADMQIGVISAMDEDMIKKLQNLGVKELIPKPIDPPTLFDALFRLCEAASQKN